MAGYLKGNLKRFKDCFGIIVLCFMLFSVPFNLFSRGGRAVFAYNMNNLGRSITAKFVQNPDCQNNLVRHF